MSSLSTTVNRNHRPSTSKPTWSSYYETWNHESTHWWDAGTSIDKGRSCRTTKELYNVLETNPCYGLLLCDEKDEILVMHALKLDQNSLYGCYGNRTTSLPVEVGLTTRTLSRIKLTNATDPVELTVDETATTLPANDDDESTDQTAVATIKNPKKQTKKKQTKKKGSDNATNTVTTPSFLLVHPCILARILPLTKPYKAPDIRAALERLESDILERMTDDMTDVIPAIHAINQRIVMFCDICGTDQHYRTPLSPILDEERATAILESLIPVNIELLFAPPNPVGEVWHQLSPIPTQEHPDARASYNLPIQETNPQTGTNPRIPTDEHVTNPEGGTIHLRDSEPVTVTPQDHGHFDVVQREVPRAPPDEPLPQNFPAPSQTVATANVVAPPPENGSLPAMLQQIMNQLVAPTGPTNGSGTSPTD